jgi:hypothetical protein
VLNCSVLYNILSVWYICLRIQHIAGSLNVSTHVYLQQLSPEIFGSSVEY